MCYYYIGWDHLWIISSDLKKGRKKDAVSYLEILGDSYAGHKYYDDCKGAAVSLAAWLPFPEALLGWCLVFHGWWLEPFWLLTFLPEKHDFSLSLFLGLLDKLKNDNLSVAFFGLAPFTLEALRLVIKQKNYILILGLKIFLVLKNKDRGFVSPTLFMAFSRFWLGYQRFKFV